MNRGIQGGLAAVILVCLAVTASASPIACAHAVGAATLASNATTIAVPAFSQPVAIRVLPGFAVVLQAPLGSTLLGPANVLPDNGLWTIAITGNHMVVRSRPGADPTAMTVVTSDGEYRFCLGVADTGGETTSMVQLLPPTTPRHPMFIRNK